MSLNTNSIGWHLPSHCQYGSVESLNSLGSQVSDGRLAGDSHSAHTHRQEPPPQSQSVSARAGRGLQVFSAGSSAQPLHPPSRGLPQATSFQALEAGFPLWSLGLHPTGTAVFFCSRVADIFPRYQVQEIDGKRYQWKVDSGTSTGRPSGVTPMSTGHNHQSPILPLTYTKTPRQDSIFGLQFPHQY